MTERHTRRLEKLRDATRIHHATLWSGIDRSSIATAKAKRRAAIEDACSSVWINMFDRELKDDEFESGIISGLDMIEWLCSCQTN